MVAGMRCSPIIVFGFELKEKTRVAAGHCVIRCQIRQIRIWSVWSVESIQPQKKGTPIFCLKLMQRPLHVPCLCTY